MHKLSHISVHEKLGTLSAKCYSYIEYCRSYYDSTHDVSKIDLDLEKNSNIKDLFRGILERLDIFELNLESLNNNLNKEIDEKTFIKNELQNTRMELVNIKNNNNKLNKEIYNLNEEFYYMDCKIIENNQYARRESVIISGIPESIDQNHLEGEVLHILRSIGLTSLSSYHISACHRLFKKKNDRFPAQTIIRFTNRKIVNFCLENRNRLLELKDYLKMNLRIYESL